MSHYSASMSWDLTRLTSSKVVVHNTCSTGTAIDKSEVYRYHRYGNISTGTSTGGVPRGRSVGFRTATAQCSGLLSTISYLAIVTWLLFSFREWDAGPNSGGAQAPTAGRRPDSPVGLARCPGS